jgi:hypothetical protein
MRYHVGGLMPALVAAARGKWPQFESQAVANLLYSLAVMQPTAPNCKKLFTKLANFTRSRVPRFNAQNVANTAWAYSVVMAQQVDRQLAMELLQRAVEVRADLTAENMSQLHTLMMVLQPTAAEMADASQQHPGLQLLLEECMSVALTRATDPTTSRSQHHIFDTLKGMREHAVLEYPAAGGLFSVDVALNPEAGQRVAVEVDGPSHVTRNQPYHELGHTVLRRRLLVQAGWKVVNVSVYDWEAAPDKENYLRQMLGL